MPDWSKNCSVWGMQGPVDTHAGAWSFNFVPGESMPPSPRITCGNRREHELPHIKTRLLALDFILANPQENYFETAEEKRRYFIERFKVDESLFSPTGTKRDGISFSDRFPLCIAYPAPEYMP